MQNEVYSSACSPLTVSFNRHFAGMTAVVVALVWILPSCQRPPHDESAKPAARFDAGPVRALSQDEAAGGHTLTRHVGKTDADLRERLQREPDISAASTYTDRATAERVVGITLQQAQSRIERWLERTHNHPNLVLDYRGDRTHPIGRTLHRSGSGSQACSNAVVILHWDGERRYHVLTSYPECR